jgi:hypothetical protein
MSIMEPSTSKRYREDPELKATLELQFEKLTTDCGFLELGELPGYLL